MMPFREVRRLLEPQEALETIADNAKRVDFKHQVSRRQAWFTDLSKKATFSRSAEAQKWSPFPRLKSRGPIEA
jgi:hypothetical protein